MGLDHYQWWYLVKHAAYAPGFAEPDDCHQQHNRTD
jgi:hypothetical protein